MEKIRNVDVNTIIGEPITSPDGTLIIPVSKVATALRQAVRICLPKRGKQRLLWRRRRWDVTIQPVAFLTVYQGDVELVSVDRKK